MPFSRFSKLVDLAGENGAFVDASTEMKTSDFIAKSDFRFIKISSIKKLYVEDYVYDICNEDSDEVDENSLTIENTMLHNCVLWWDEVDDLFSGSESSGFSDGGTTSRVIGIISTWLSEHKGLVFNIFTANDVSRRPPKLFRKGRIDEIFIVDLPVEEERKEIFEIHISKRRDSDYVKKQKINIGTLAKATRMFSGSEIKEVVNSAFITAYNDGKREVGTKDFEEAIGATVPISCTMKEKLDEMRRWQKGRAVRASEYPPEEIVDIQQYKGGFNNTEEAPLELD